jgi:hypothetical protein
MSNNIDQRSIDQAISELKRVDAAIEDALIKLRKPATAPDAHLDLATARKRLALALRQLK